MNMRLRIVLTLVIGCAVILSFTGLFELAIMCGFHPILAALVPVLTDTGAGLAAGAWLDRDAAPAVRRYARRVALSLIGATVLGNAASHLLTTLGVAPPWWVVVVLGTLAPAVLAADLHLYALLHRSAEDATAPVDTPAEVLEEVVEEVGVPFIVETPRQTPCHVYRLFDTGDELLYVGVGYDVATRCREHKRKKAWWSEVVRGSVTTYPTRPDALLAERDAIAHEDPRHNILPGGPHDHAAPFDLTAPWVPHSELTPADPLATRENVPVAELHAPFRGVDIEDDNALADSVVRWSEEEGSMPSRERVRQRFRIGSRRADRIRGLVEARTGVESGGSDPSPDPTTNGKVVA